LNLGNSGLAREDASPKPSSASRPEGNALRLRTKPGPGSLSRRGARMSYFR